MHDILWLPRAKNYPKRDVTIAWIRSTLIQTVKIAVTALTNIFITPLYVIPSTLANLSHIDSIMCKCYLSSIKQ